MDLESLKFLTELKYTQSLSGMAEIRAKEARLRHMIERLKQQAFEAQALPADQLDMHNIGADVIWLKWVSKTVRNLNLELAQLLAQKETYLAGQRRALGRKTAAEHTFQKERTARQRTKQANALQTAINLSMQTKDFRT